MADDWITTSRASKLSGYHPERIRELARYGAIDARKFGIVWQISRSALLQYLDDAKKSTDDRRGPRHGRD